MTRAALAAALLIVGPVAAQEVAAAKPAQGFLDRWNDFAQGELVRIQASDPYGATFQLPKGYLKLAYRWESLHGNSRFDDSGHLGPVIPTLQFQAGGSPQLDVDFGVHGHGGSHVFQLGYGITDQVSWFAEIPYTYMSVQTDLQVGAVDDQGNHIGATAAGLLGVTDRKNYGPVQFLYQTLPQLGRPVLGDSFRGAWLLGDVNTGVAYNYYRSSRFSAAVTGRLFLPTAYIPPPERDILYATGPEIESGTGGWGLGLTQQYDVRLYQGRLFQIVAGGDVSAGYHFPQERPYPNDFVAPNPVAAGLSPQAFPDLSQLSGDFKLIPGWGLQSGAHLDIGLALVGLSVGYSIKYAQKPQMIGDPGFVGMVNALGLLGETEARTVSVGAGVSLIPIKIPARLIFTWQRVVGGRNVLLFQDDFTIGLDGYIPTRFFLKS